METDTDMSASSGGEKSYVASAAESLMDMVYFRHGCQMAIARF